MSRLSHLVLVAAIFFTVAIEGGILFAKQPDNRPVLRVVYGDFYPYGFTGTDGRAQGFSIDVIRNLTSSAGYDVQFVPAENPRQFLSMLARGEVDMTTFLALTPERRAAGLATASLGAYILSVYVRHDSTITDIDGLLGKRIGAVAGSIGGSAAAMLASVEVIEFRSADAQLLPLLRGDVDAVVVVTETFDEKLRTNFIKDKVRQLSPPLVITPYGLILRKDLPEVHAALEHVIADTGTPAMLKKARVRWFGSDISIINHPWFGNVAMIVGGIALTTFSLGIYTFRLRRRANTLASEHSANKLLIDALDQMRAAITIFDSDIKAVHWNSGFEARFPGVVPFLKDGATLEQACNAFYATEIIATEAGAQGMTNIARGIVDKLRQGQTYQQIVHTILGDSFDLSIFPLGARYYAAIWVDVTELHNQQQQVEEQRVELAQNNQQLLTFSSMVAHDLKAPLMQQKMLLEFIAEDIDGAKLQLPAEVKTNLDTLSDLSVQMSLLVSDLLDYAKADSAQAPAQCFVPNTRLDGIIKLAAPKSMLSVVVMPDMPAVQVEPTCFDMVMRNLITNAAKHHDKPSGTITLRAYRTPTHVMIEVEDDGPGIGILDHVRIFEPFARLTNVEGSGLGLAFVQKTVVNWGGTISIKAAAVRGCIFCISVPAAPDNVIAIPLASTSPDPRKTRIS